LTRNVDDPDLVYEAVSYAWGDQSLRESIICNEQHLSITRSLHAALAVFRLPDEPRTLWADAVCINQEDVEERSCQVELMRPIYKGASEVLIWLGHENSATVRLGMQQICDVLNAKRTSDSTVVHYQWLGLARSSGGDEAPELTTQTKDASPLKRLFESTWFRRLWVIQEVVVSTSACLFWGYAAIDFRWVGQLAYHMRFQNEALRITLIGNVFSYNVQHAAWIFELWTDRHRRQTFANLLRAAVHFDVTDPRDRVYGMLGIPTIERDPQSSDLFLQPNYELSTSDLWQTVTKKLLTEQRDLRILSLIMYDDYNLVTLPSWVPTFDDTSRSMLTDGDIRPDGGMEPFISMVDQSENCICIRGVEVDTIEALIGNNSPEPTSESLRGGRRARSLLDLISSLKSEYDIETIACTLTGGSPMDDLLVYDYDLGAHVKSLDAFIELCMAKQDLDHGNIVLTELTPAESHICVYLDRFRRVSARRRFFKTKHGLLGLGPDSALEGDILCLLFGAPLPFLLRPAEGRFRLVGECYVHDVNTGKTMEEWKATGEATTDFHIF
jgi:hypothetical protein